MGACNSSAALEPADITAADGTAPVFWSPEREQEKRLAKLREIQIKQQAEIERATGHLKGKQQQRRRTTSKSTPDEEKQQADTATATTPAHATDKVRPVLPSHTRAVSRAVSMSLPSSPERPHVMVSEEELSDYPVPKSARRLARATSASIASPTRSPEVSVSVGRRSDSELSSTPRQQSTPMAAARRSSAVPEPVKEEEQRHAEAEEKECDASTPLPSHNTIPAITATTPAAVSVSPVRVVTLRPVTTLREEKVQEVDCKPSVASSSAAFGVSLRKVPTVSAVAVAAAC